MRHCFICGAPISECMGFVHAGDFLLLLLGQPVQVREFCGLCDYRMGVEEVTRERGNTDVGSN